MWLFHSTYQMVTQLMSYFINKKCQKLSTKMLRVSINDDKKGIIQSLTKMLFRNFIERMKQLLTKFPY